MNKDLEKKLVELVGKTRGGSSIAYRQFLEACLPMIRQSARFHLSRFGQLSFVEDVAQDTLLAIHQKLHTYDSRYEFIPWLRAVTRHKAFDFLRKNRMKLESLDEENNQEWEDSAGRQDMTAQRDLDELLKRLKPPAGEIIYMLKVEGVSVSDLAKKFKLSESNIKTTVHRGLARLAKFVSEEQVRTQ